MLIYFRFGLCQIPVDNLRMPYGTPEITLAKLALSASDYVKYCPVFCKIWFHVA